MLGNRPWEKTVPKNSAQNSAGYGERHRAPSGAIGRYRALYVGKTRVLALYGARWRYFHEPDKREVGRSNRPRPTALSEAPATTYVDGGFALLTGRTLNSNADSNKRSACVLSL